MAYDPKDPKDKKIVDDLIAEALAEANQEHEANIAGLKKKNEKLIERNKRIAEGRDNPEELTRLESELEEARSKISKYEKDLKVITKERDTFKTTSEQESAASRKYLVDHSLTESLIAANVGKHFLPAVKAMLESKVEVKPDGDKRVLTVEGKPLSEFVTAWSQSDQGKAYIVAAASGGGSASGGKALDKTQKTITRAEFESNPSGYKDFFKEGGKIE